LKRVKGPDGYFYTEYKKFHEHCYWGLEALVSNQKASKRKNKVPSKFLEISKISSGGRDELCLRTVSIQSNKT
jgi:hypothetical protein